MKTVISIALVFFSLSALAQTPSSNSTEGQIKALKATKMNLSDSARFVPKLVGYRLMSPAEISKLISIATGATNVDSTLLVRKSTYNSNRTVDQNTLASHSGNTSNPHNVTKTQVGLGNVPNTDATNPANIVQSSSYRFSSDTEKATWNGKIDQTAGDTRYRRLTIPLSNTADVNNDAAYQTASQVDTKVATGVASFSSAVTSLVELPNWAAKTQLAFFHNAFPTSATATSVAHKYHIGDSVGGDLAYLYKSDYSAYGFGGMIGGPSQISYATTVSSATLVTSSNKSKWMTGISYQISTGGYVDWSPYTQMYDALQSARPSGANVFYVPGSYTFKLQASPYTTQGDAAYYAPNYVDISGVIDASSATGLGYATGNFPDATHYYRVRVLVLSGQGEIVDYGMTGTNGVSMHMQGSASGTVAIDYANTPAAVWDAWFAAAPPDLVTIHFKDRNDGLDATYNPGNFTFNSALQFIVARIKAANPRCDIVMIGTYNSQGADAVAPDPNTDGWYTYKAFANDASDGMHKEFFDARVLWKTWTAGNAMGFYQDITHLSSLGKYVLQSNFAAKYNLYPAGSANSPYTLAPTPVTAGTYGTAAKTPTITVGQDGRINSVTETNIAAPFSSFTSVSASLTVTAGDIGKLYNVTTGSSAIVLTCPQSVAIQPGFYFFIRKEDTGTGYVWTSQNPMIGMCRYQGETVMVLWNGTGYVQIRYGFPYSVLTEDNNTNTNPIKFIPRVAFSSNIDFDNGAGIRYKEGSTANKSGVATFANGVVQVNTTAALTATSRVFIGAITNLNSSTAIGSRVRVSITNGQNIVFAATKTDGTTETADQSSFSWFIVDSY